MPFEYREHTGEVHLVGIGKSIEEAFAEGAKALFNLMANLDHIEPKEAVEISCRGENLEMLFVEWLNALILHKDAQGFVFSRFEIEPIRKTTQGYELASNAWGEPFNPKKHESRVDVKAATYAGLKCEKTSEGCRVECVVDI